MKILLISLIHVILFSNFTFAQQVKYQTFKAKMSIVGEKDGEKMQWDNNNITVALDYENGNFISRLKNTDFYLKDNDFPINEAEREEREIILKGIFPINQMINQRQINATYNLELELITPNGSYFLNFNIDVTRPNDGQSYRIFVMRGIFYNDETNFPAFKGYQNEINLILGFNAFSNK